MNLFCPSCEAAYAGAAVCPKCGGRLITPAEAYSLPGQTPPAAPPLDRPTVFTRVGVGAIVGLGLYLAGRDWAAAVAVPEGSAAKWWAGPTGEAVAFGLRAFAAAVGGLLAGAGRPQGAVTGLIVGAVLGGLFLTFEPTAGKAIGVPPPALIAGLAVLAAAGGMLGAKVWPVAVEPPLADAGGSRGSSLTRLADEQRQFNLESSRPTRWVRVAIAAAVAVVGVAYADAIRAQVKALGVRGTLSNPAMETTVDLGIALIAVVAGGLTAGATTGAGLRHGLIAGALAVGGVFAQAPRVPNEAGLRPLISFLELVEVDPPELAGVQPKAIIGGAILGAFAFTGWLGNQLLPPLAPPSMRKRKLPIS